MVVQGRLARVFERDCRRSSSHGLGINSSGESTDSILRPSSPLSFLFPDAVFGHGQGRIPSHRADSSGRALRVQKLGVGLKLNTLKSDDIASALRVATTSKTMIEKATRSGQMIRSENGVDNAVEAIQFYISRAAADRRKMHWQK